jgi:hypothetical protein
MQEMHIYERLPLFGTGLVLALAMIGISSYLLARPEPCARLLKKLPRNHMAGQVLLGIGMIWFWLLVAPEGLGILSALEMDLGEFNNAKKLLRIAVPVTFILVCISVKEFLAVRALGLLGLMIAAPLLEAAFLKDPASRILIPVFAYALIIKSMFWIGMPYTFRDAANWATASSSRLRACAAGGLAYGLLVLVCALAFWRGH